MKGTEYDLNKFFSSFKDFYKVKGTGGSSAKGSSLLQTTTTTATPLHVSFNIPKTTIAPTGTLKLIPIQKPSTTLSNVLVGTQKNIFENMARIKRF